MRDLVAGALLWAWLTAFGALALGLLFGAGILIGRWLA